MGPAPSVPRHAATGDLAQLYSFTYLGRPAMPVLLIPDDLGLADRMKEAGVSPWCPLLSAEACEAHRWEFERSKNRGWFALRVTCLCPDRGRRDAVNERPSQGQKKRGSEQASPAKSRVRRILPIGSGDISDLRFKFQTSGTPGAAQRNVTCCTAAAGGSCPPVSSASNAEGFDPSMALHE